jgi:hypothetical protein
MFGKYDGFVSKARVSACMYFLVSLIILSDLSTGYCCLVILLTSVSTISYAESNGSIFVLIGRIKPEIRHSPRLIGKKTFLEKRNSENMKGLF